MKIIGVDVAHGLVDLSPDGRLTVIGCQFPIGAMPSIQPAGSPSASSARGWPPRGGGSLGAEVRESEATDLAAKRVAEAAG
jgi:hypothetical protein